MKILDTEEMLAANLLALKQKRKKELIDVENKVISEMNLAPPISEIQVRKQLAFIDKHNWVENKTNCVLITKSSKVRAAYNKMIRNDIKTIGE